MYIVHFPQLIYLCCLISILNPGQDQDGVATSFEVPFCIPILIFVDPCTPPFLLSMTEGCRDIEWVTLRPEMLVVLFDAWMGLCIYVTGTTCIFFILFIGTTTMLDYFHILKRSV